MRVVYRMSIPRGKDRRRASLRWNDQRAASRSTIVPIVTRKGLRSTARVPQVSAGCSQVSDALFDLFDLRTAPFTHARPDDLGVKANLKHASCTGYQRDFADLALERCQKFLCHPGCPQQPSALRAIFDFYSRTLWRYHCCAVARTRGIRSRKGPRCTLPPLPGHSCLAGTGDSSPLS
jgi:hypothetical protein